MLVGIVSVEREIQTKVCKSRAGDEQHDVPAQPIGEQRNQRPDYE